MRPFSGHPSFEQPFSRSPGEGRSRARLAACLLLALSGTVSATAAIAAATATTAAAAIPAASAASADRPSAESPRTDGGRFEHAVGDDRFAAGGQLALRERVPGDLVAAGGELTLRNRVEGDALLAGGQLRITDDAELARGLNAAAGRIELEGRIERNARLAGGQVEVRRQARIGGNLGVAGGNLRIEGAVGGHLAAAGGTVTLDGPVTGDVDVAADRVELGPRARIDGRLRHASRQPLARDPAAQVAGGIEAIDLADRVDPGAAARGAGRVGLWFWTVGMMALAAVSVALMPAFGQRLGATLADRPGKVAILGLAAIAGIPFAIVALLATVIGVPAALMALAAYPALLIAGYAAGCVAIADALVVRLRAGRRDPSHRWVDRRRRVAPAAESVAAGGGVDPGPPAGRWVRAPVAAAAAAAALLASLLAAWLPGGWLVPLAVLVVGVGALLAQLRPSRDGVTSEPRPAAPGPTFPETPA